jgi:uncharacterized membrane protein YfcA
MSAPVATDLAWILIALASGGFSKGLTGLGLPLIAVPVLAGVFGVERAVLIMIIPSMLLNQYVAWTHRDTRHELPEMGHILLGAIPGVVIGAGVLQRASSTFLSTSLAIWIIVYVLLRLVHPHFRIALPARRRWSTLVGTAAGALQAATGISAPIVAAYMDAIGLQPRAYVFAVSVCFGALATVHFLLVAISGAYTRELLVQSSVAIVPALACIPLGIRARQFVSRDWFDWIIRLTLATMAGRMLYETWFISS